jgi:hypothetical protein
MDIDVWRGGRLGARPRHSLTRRSGGGLAVNNATGVGQLRWGWGL